MPIVRLKVTGAEKRQLNKANLIIALSILPLFIVLGLTFGLPKIGMELPHHDQFLGLSGFLAFGGFFVGVILKLFGYGTVLKRKTQELGKSKNTKKWK